MHMPVRILESQLDHKKNPINLLIIVVSLAIAADNQHYS